MLRRIRNWFVIPVCFAIIALLILGNSFYIPQKTEAEVLTWTSVFSETTLDSMQSIINVNSRLYAGTLDSFGGASAVYTSINGTNWQQITPDAFGTFSTATYDFTQYNNYIYTGEANAAGSIMHSCHLTDDCTNAGNWGQITLAGFGDVNNTSIRALYTYNGSLYAGTYNIAAGSEVWSCTVAADTGCTVVDWVQVDGGNGFGDINNDIVTSLVQFGTRLYAGTMNGPTGSQIWRCTTCDGTDWVAVENTGFGNPNNWTVQSLAVFNNELYAGTEKGIGPPAGGEMWKTTNGINWSQVGTSEFQSENPSRTLYTLHRDTYGNGLFLGTYSGDALIWSTPNGSDWEQINTNGFGDNVSGTYSMAMLHNYLYAASGNIGGGGVASIYRASLSPAVTPGSATASQILDGTGHVNISFQASDPDYNNLRAKIEYSLDNGATWGTIKSLSTADADTTATYGDPKVNNDAEYQIGTVANPIITSSGANTVNTIWNSKDDTLTANTNNAMIRVTPNDFGYDGTTVVSASFSLDNVGPSINLTVSPSKAKKNTELRIEVRTNGQQSENPTVTIDGNAATTENADPNARIIIYSYRVQGTEQEGNIPIIATARDAAGNTSTASTTVSLDFTPPIITAHPNGGSYNSAQNIRLTANESVSKIRYTTDNSDPRANGIRYQNPITISENTTLKFYGTDLYGNSSSVQAQIYSFDFDAPITSANPPGGVYENPQAVTLSSNKPATIYFTTNGSEPNENSAVYNDRILISQNTTLKFYGVDGANNKENTHTELYVITSTSPYITLTKTFGISSATGSVSTTGSSALKSIASSIYNFNIKSKFNFILSAIIIFWSFVLIILFIISFFKNNKKIKKAVKYLLQKQTAASTTIISIIGLAIVLQIFIGLTSKAAAVSRGDVLTYRIDYQNQGQQETTDLRIVDSISSSTSYLPSSIVVNGIGQSDNRDNDSTDYNRTNLGAVTVDIGRVVPNSSGFVQFQVQVNSDVPFGAIIDNTGIGSYNPGAIFTQSNTISNTVTGAFGGPFIIKEEEKKEPQKEEEPEKFIEVIEKIIPKKIIDNIVKNINAIFKALQQQNIKEIFQNIIAPLATITSILSMLAAIPLVNSFLPYLAYLLQYLTHPALFFGKRKRWGVVYDSLTKHPLDLAIVRLFNKENNKLVSTRITDFQGRYLFIIDPGNYYLTVTKPYYVFPAKLIAEKTESIYLGETISVRSNNNLQKEKGIISFDIPVDPKEGFIPHPANPSKIIATPVKNINDLNTLPKEIIKKANDNLLKAKRSFRFNFFIALLGPIIGLICLIISPSIFTAVLFVIDILLFMLFRRLAIKRLNTWGKTIDAEKHKALPKTIVRLFDSQYGRLLLADISKNDGRYGFLVGKDKYTLTSQKTGYELPQHQINVSGDKEGIISQNLELKKVNGI